MLPQPFSRVSPSARTSLALAPGQVIFRQDGETSAMYFLHRGNVELQRHSRAGEKLVIHRVSAGETFAEASLFSNVYHCDAVATVAGQVERLDKKAVLELFRTDAEFAGALAARFASQVQAYRRRIELMAIKSAKRRVHAAVMDGVMTSSAMALSAEIGLTHEATYRALAALVNEGVLERVARGKYRLSG